jgi:hypothetical protein
MATGYFLCTDESEVFHTFFLTAGEVLTTGQPVTNSYNSEEVMAQAIGTYTGNPNFYYEELTLPLVSPPGPEPESEAGNPIQVTNTTYGPTSLQAWVAVGDLDYLDRTTITIQQGPFLISGIVSLIQPFSHNQTFTTFNLISNNTFQPYTNYQMDGLVGTIISSGAQSPYLFFSGITNQIIFDPTVQGYYMFGDLRDYAGYRVWYYENENSIGEAQLQVVSFDENNYISQCHLIVGGNAIPYSNSNFTTSFIITNDVSASLPPEITRIEGNGRTVYQDPTSSYQYYDLFDDAQMWPANLDTTIHIFKNSVEITGQLQDVFHWGEEALPCSRFSLNISAVPQPFVDQGVPITWYIDLV